MDSAIMSAMHSSHLHGQGPRTKHKYNYSRQRVQESQKVKPEDSVPSKATKEESSPKPPRSSNGVVLILVLMIGVTWGIAATSYFGVVDYKALIDQCYDAYFNEDPYEIIDKRRPVTGTSPSRQMKRSLDAVTKDKVEEPPAVDVPAPETEDVGKGKEPQSQQQEQPEETKQSEDKPKPDAEPESSTKSKQADKKGDESKPKEDKGKSTEPAKKKKPKITSDDDKPILEKLKEGEKLLTQNKAEPAWKFFTKLATDNPKSPRARFGKARAEAMLAAHQKSNPMLKQAINTYNEVAEMQNSPKELKKRSLMEKSEKEMFLGRMKPSLHTQLQLANLYPTDVEVLNKLGVRYLMTGQNKGAKLVYEKVLKLKPDDGFALVHMGFIVKNAGDWAESIDYLRRGTESGEPGTQEGKFYFHLGDALHRTNRTSEAQEVYDMAAKKGLFRSRYQRSLYNVDRLRGQPFWTPQEAGVKDYVRRLEINWKVIRDEALSVMNKDTGSFLLEEESLKDTGEWRQFTLYQRGVKNEANCRRTPKTCSIIERMPNSRGCRRGQTKFSVMMPGTHVWPHTGPTNCRLRMHLGLVIPTTGSGARLQCAGEMRTWEEGKVFIFDDSFEHEVWQEAESLRLILIVDIWHPELTEHEKQTLSSI